MILLGLVLAVVATVAARRLFGDDDGRQTTPDLEVETDAPASGQ